MFTVIATPTFSSRARQIWSEDEVGEFCAWIAAHPTSGEVIPASGGCRKVRFVRPGMGKRGGARVIYFNRLEHGSIVLLTVYAKAVTGNIPAHLLRAIKIEVERSLHDVSRKNPNG